ncbi:acyl-CoA carboxylase subunit epsilon [Prauserella rugosa]|uniref:Acyl-CoA carboxylase epsilon subunit-like protein n=1 Tax=Prauserella rugosa TaxID=43354 RepID=A0A660CMD5_9PSEU|nr:acyl-CoA carboxylase subunit epsilon [Prauserella rugosa]KMS90062.1 acetyl-CoA carboxylase [Streptomyces regensis]TWH22401.1 acyl-CoA carboxylase epsilon subunit-like protein [Prauserella rugosa]
MSTADETEAAEPSQPLLRVVRGEPDDTELAALTAVVASLAASGGETDGDDTPARSRWADRAALVRAPLTPGPGAWRASAFRR